MRRMKWNFSNRTLHSKLSEPLGSERHDGWAISHCPWASEDETVSWNRWRSPEVGEVNRCFSGDVRVFKGLGKILDYFFYSFTWWLILKKGEFLDVCILYLTEVGILKMTLLKTKYLVTFFSPPQEGRNKWGCIGWVWERTFGGWDISKNTLVFITK